MRVEYREERCRSALNRVAGMGFRWSLNPYMGCAHRCTFCYVRAYERRADRPSDARYGWSIRVKTNVAEVLARELARDAWKREEVGVGSATDPYQPAEGRYRLTRACLGALAERRTPFNLITRGPLVVRDLDVLQHAATRADVSVSFSVPTLDERVWRATEPGTPPPRARLRALERLVAGGIRAGVAMAPVLPGLSDAPEQLAEVVRSARGAGATFLWVDLVSLREGVREHFLECLATDRPELVPRYQELFARGAYLRRARQDEVRERVAELKRAHGLGDRRALRLRPPEEAIQVQLPL
jgi:DNA repair photolyase